MQPRREEDEPVVSSSKKYREIKEKLRRQKEKELARKRAGGARAGSSKSGKSGRERRRDKPKSSADSDDSNISMCSHLLTLFRNSWKVGLLSWIMWIVCNCNS